MDLKRISLEFCDKSQITIDHVVDVGLLWHLDGRCYDYLHLRLPPKSRDFSAMQKQPTPELLAKARAVGDIWPDTMALNEHCYEEQNRWSFMLLWNATSIYIYKYIIYILIYI